jgi:ubiquinone/menaquinone biosynthesis C-methylase UbiE
MKGKVGTFVKDRDYTMGAYAPYYDFLMKILTLGRERALRQLELDIVKISQGNYVLEVGCGTGTLTLLAKDWTGNGGKVCGIDAAPEMIQRAKTKANRKNKDVEFQVGDISNIPYEDSKFDIVMCSFMIFHMSSEKRERGIKEIFRVLKNNGAFVVVDTIKEEGISILNNSMKLLFYEIEWGFKKTGFLSPQLAFIRGIAKKSI